MHGKSYALNGRLNQQFIKEQLPVSWNLALLDLISS